MGIPVAQKKRQAAKPTSSATCPDHGMVAHAERRSISLSRPAAEEEFDLFVGRVRNPFRNSAFPKNARSQWRLPKLSEVMMLDPLRQWYCDTCGGVIAEPHLGYVIWKMDDEGRNCGFKVIHQSICDRKGYSLSGDIKSFLGEDGLNHLLSFLSIGPIKTRLREKNVCEVADLDEFVDLMRRMQLPFYEEARRRFSDEDVLYRFADANEEYP